jgi:hypothetical protein
MPCVCNLAGWLHGEYLSSHVAWFVCAVLAVNRPHPFLAVVAAVVCTVPRSAERHLFRRTAGFRFPWLEKAVSYYSFLSAFAFGGGGGEGAFVQLRKETICFVVPIRPSVRPHGTARLLLYGFPWHFTFEDYKKRCGENSGWLKSDKKAGLFTRRRVCICDNI